MEVHKIYIEQNVILNWSHSNKKRYIDLGYIFSCIGQEFSVNARDLPKHSKMKIDVKCDHCNESYKLSYAQIIRASNHICSAECKFKFGKTELECYTCQRKIFKNNTQIKNSKTDHHFCSNKCVGKFNSGTRSQNLTKNCLICNKKFPVKLSTMKTQITCSRRCQGKWQSQFRIGENSSNFKGGNVVKVCKECNQEYETRRYHSEGSSFCSVDCRKLYWIKHVITKDSFKQSKYEGISRYRQKEISETKPERMVREWLEANNISFKQEQGFFHRYYADFYIPDTNIVIEVNGDYWHANPTIYGEGHDQIPLSNSQIEQIAKDKKKLEDFIKYGFQVIVLWEKDIYEDCNKLLKNNVLTLIPRNDYTQDIC